MSTQLYDKSKTPIQPITDIGSVTGLSAKLDEIKTELEGKVSFSKDELKDEILNEVEKNFEDLDLTSQYKSTVFIRVSSKPASPEGGNWDSPIPTKDAKDYTTGNILTDVFGNTLRWSDGIPDGELPLWASTCIFSTDESKNGTWTEPRKMTDTADFQVVYSNQKSPKAPIKIETSQTEDDWLSNNPDWEDEANTESIWMATSVCSNGVWEDWQVSKIKGEDGKDGTGVTIKGTLESENELPEKPTNDSDSYLIKGELWVWDGDSWVNVGSIKGEKGDSAYVHIKYANKATGAEEIIFNVLGVQLTPTESNGETPGNYIGTKVDNIEKDDQDWLSYTWAKWTGEDGFGYEYIYTLSNTAPAIPTQQKNSNGDEFVNNDFVPDDWADNPLDPKKDGDEALHCWICTRQKVDGVWQSFRGNPNEEYKNQAALYSRYVENGLPGKSALTMNFLEDSITVPCDSNGKLFTGEHFGSGNENDETGQLFNIAYALNFDQGYSAQNVFVYYGTKEVTSEMTFSIVEQTGLNCVMAQSEFTYVDIMGFDETNPRSGSLILKAEHSDYGSISHRVTITKIYSGKDGNSAEFEYYQIHPEVNQILAEFDGEKVVSVNPSTFSFKLGKYTQSGKEIVDILDPYRIYLTSHKIDGTQVGIFATATLVDSYNISGISSEVSYIIMHLYDSNIGIQADLDTERIPVLWKYSGVSVEIPSWVTEWNGTSAQFNGKNVLAAQAYVGDKPVEGISWTGLLMGSDIASLENWPYDDDNDSTTTYDFSGLLAVKNFDSTQGDNIVGKDNADVTFAVDSRTGDAYFKGEVHATSGTFSGELKAATGTFSGELTAASGSFSGELTAATGNIENVTAKNLTINEGTINSTGTATDGSEYITQIGGTLLETPNLAYLQKKNTSDSDDGYYFKIGGFEVDSTGKITRVNALSMGTGDIAEQPDTQKPYFEVNYYPDQYQTTMFLQGTNVRENDVSYGTSVTVTGTEINAVTSNTNEEYCRVVLYGSGITITSEKTGVTISLGAGGVRFEGLPTKAGMTGELYNDNGTLKISQ